MTATNDSMKVSRELKVLFLQIMQKNILTKENARALNEIFVENGLIPPSTHIVFGTFNNDDDDDE